MTQNGLKHILNMFLKSVTRTDLDPPPNVKNVTLSFFLFFEVFPNSVENILRCCCWFVCCSQEWYLWLGNDFNCYSSWAESFIIVYFLDLLIYSS